MSYDRNPITFFNSAFLRLFGLEDGTKSLKASAHPSCFVANNEGVGINR